MSVTAELFPSQLSPAACSQFRPPFAPRVRGSARGGSPEPGSLRAEHGFGCGKRPRQRGPRCSALVPHAAPLWAGRGALAARRFVAGGKPRRSLPRGCRRAPAATAPPLGAAALRWPPAAGRRRSGGSCALRPLAGEAGPGSGRSGGQGKGPRGSERWGRTGPARWLVCCDRYRLPPAARLASSRLFPHRRDGFRRPPPVGSRQAGLR